MKDFTNNPSKLVLILATELEKSGCNVDECVRVLAVLTGALIGRYAPDIAEIERYCDALFETIPQAAISFHNNRISHIKTTLENNANTNL